MLGVDWLRSLGTIQWNFVDLSIKFSIGGKIMVLQGLRISSSSLEEESKLNKATLSEGRGLWLQLMEAEEPKIQTKLDMVIQEVLDNFQAIFEEPKGLPPQGDMII